MIAEVRRPHSNKLKERPEEQIDMDKDLTKINNLKHFEELADDLLDEHAKYYYYAGANTSSVPRDNEDALQKYRIQPQVLRDTSKANLNCEVLNSKLHCPIGIAPTGFHFFAHKDAEKATALGAKEECIYIMSSVASTLIEDVSSFLKTHPYKGTLWMQMYIFKDRRVNLDLIARAEACGFSAIVVTVDSPISGQWKMNLPDGFANRIEDKFLNLPSACASLQDGTLTFEDLKWLKQHTTLPVIVKGILNGEDAVEATRSGANAIYVSNHGGRQIHKVVPTIDVLEEVVKAVEPLNVDVYFDGGVRHGSDVFIAMALGAKAVFVGRPILWGLTVSGEEGAQKVLQILKAEFLSTMKLAGVQSVKDINKSMIRKISENL